MGYGQGLGNNRGSREAIALTKLGHTISNLELQSGSIGYCSHMEFPARVRPIPIQSD